MVPTRFSLAEILVLAITAGAGKMAPSTSTRMSAVMNCVQGHASPVDTPPTGPQAQVRPGARAERAGFLGRYRGSRHARTWDVNPRTCYSVFVYVYILHSLYCIKKVYTALQKHIKHVLYKGLTHTPALAT